MSELDYLLAQQARINLYNAASLNSATMGLREGAAPLRFAWGSQDSIKVVAQGDSWFDYLPGWDVIKSLNKKAYAIQNFGTGGDTLENMLYGNGYDRDWDRQPAEHVKVLEWVESYTPKFFLFSGGGNDIAGPELAAFLNHADANLGGDIRTGYLDYMMNTVFRSYYEYMVDTVQAAHKDIHILVHGYGRPLITGLGVVNFAGWHFIGPWLKPSLVSKDITDPARQFRAVATIIESLNAMLQNLANTRQNVHYINLLNDIKPRHWINELHLSPEGFDIVGSKFDDTMKSLMTDEEKNKLINAKKDLDLFIESEGEATLSSVGLV